MNLIQDIALLRKSLDKKTAKRAELEKQLGESLDLYEEFDNIFEGSSPVSTTLRGRLTVGAPAWQVKKQFLDLNFTVQRRNGTVATKKVRDMKHIYLALRPLPAHAESVIRCVLKLDTAH